MISKYTNTLLKLKSKEQLCHGEALEPWKMDFRYKRLSVYINSSLKSPSTPWITDST